MASWLQRPPTSMASTTSLQRRVVFRPWWNREQFQRHTESMHHVSHRLRPILAIRTRPTIDRNILGCDTLMLSNCTQVKSSQVKARQGKARQGKARQGKARQARQGKARQGKARQGKARQGKARQGKARQGKARQVSTPISAGPFRAQAQNVSNCSPNMLHKGESSHRQRMQTEKHGWRGNCIDELQSQFQNHVLVCKYGPMLLTFALKRLSCDDVIPHGHAVSSSQGCVCQGTCVKSFHEEHAPNPASQTWTSTA